jgi:ribonuclease J
MSDIKIIPFGGVNEIGLNMMVMETTTESMVIDCGLMFPEPHMPGIDIVIPDFEYLLKSDKELKGVVITHGHEDHIGALPFFIRHFNPPLYGTSLTLGLLEEKLKEHDLLDRVNLVEVQHGDTVDVGPFPVEFIRVCHSIPDGSALAIKTPMGTVIHSGDFKFDDTPVDSKKPDYDRFSSYGREGVKLLMSDSTNVEVPGRTESEKILGPVFNDTFKNKSGKVFVSLFSSNINRVQQIIISAEANGRKVVLVGRSLVTNIRVARERGYLKVKSDTIVGVEEISHHPPSEIAVITTGSQGEPRSGLSLMATQSHKYISVDKGDTVILSSKSIPGNEKLICKIINQLMKIGAEVLYEKIAKVHVSGHAQAEELKMMIDMTKPEYFIPIHGERRHLVQHIKLAREMGIPEDRTLLAENGETILLDNSGLRLGEKVKTGRVFVDGKGVGDVKDLVLRDRMHLAEDGMVLSVVSVNNESGDIISGIEMFSVGFIHEDEEGRMLDDAKAVLSAWLAEACSELKTDWTEMEAETKRVLKRFFKKKTGRRPVIIPVIMEL